MLVKRHKQRPMYNQSWCNVGFVKSLFNVEVMRSLFVIIILSNGLTKIKRSSVRHCGPALIQSWANITDGVPTLNQCWDYVSIIISLLKGLAQAKIINKSVILFWPFNMTI